MARRHLVNHDADSSIVLRIVAAEALHHAAAVTITQQIKTIGIDKQTLFH